MHEVKGNEKKVKDGRGEAQLLTWLYSGGLRKLGLPFGSISSDRQAHEPYAMANVLRSEGVLCAARLRDREGVRTVLTPPPAGESTSEHQCQCPAELPKRSCR
jgi:hypothetical protein